MFESLEVTWLNLNLHELANPVGVIGVILIVSGYFFLQINRISQESLKYSLMNLLGSLCLLYSLLFYWNLSAFIINTVWFFISLYGLLKSNKRVV
jgi:hypothetical protein